MSFHPFILFTSILIGCGSSSIEVSATATEKNSSTPTDETNDTDSNDSLDTGNESSSEDSGLDLDSAENSDTESDSAEEDTNQPEPNRIADFNLPDINSGSASFGQTISPRDYIQQTTGWYFVKAT